MHPAVGAGVHRMLQAAPYIFSRTLDANGSQDRVLVAMDQGRGAKSIPVFGFFPDGTGLVDAYSGVRATVVNGRISLTTPFTLALMSDRR
jgi:alpha-amylase